MLSFQDLILDSPLFLLAQARYVPPVDSPRESALELRQQSHVFVVGLDIVLAQDAESSLLLEWIL